jgi:hypothetical protein
VDGDGLACGSGDLHLRNEGGLLDRDFGVFEVVVVEADLADSEAARIGCEFGQLGERVGRGSVGLLRMNARGGEDLRVCVGEIERVVHLVGAFADADRKQQVYL